jgi:uncharacterized protein (TIGR02271 family)
MLVYSFDGTKLGKIVSCRPDGFVVEKGMFLPKASQFQYEDVAELRNGEVYLAHRRTQLADQGWWARRGEATAARPQAAGDGPYRAAPTAVAKSDVPAVRTEEGGPSEYRVPLAEERITTEKRTRDLGEVRLHKRIVVEKKQITVPVMHEEVYVERVTLEPASAPQPSEGAFVESTITIPLHEEEVQIFKRPVVREEVRVRRQALQEDRTTTAEIRKEELDIDQPQGLSQHLHRSP